MTAARVLEVARSQLGTVESPPGSNKTRYGQAYGVDGVAWCAQFVWWVFREAGSGPLIPKTAYTPTFAAWFKERLQWGSRPRPGAVVFFDFPGDTVHRISHVGIVEAVNRDGSITTIEGNTARPGASGSQRDGGGVWRRTRSGPAIVGYGYPAYPAAAPPPAASEQDDDMTPDQARMLTAIHANLTEIHAKLTAKHPTRVDFSLLGGSPSSYADDVGGYAVNADARAFEARQLALGLHSKVDDLRKVIAAAAGSGSRGPAVLSDADVDRVATAVIARLGEKTSAP